MQFLTIQRLGALVLLSFCLPAFSQVKDTISLNTIIAKTGNSANNYPAEKVYLHLDKPYYAVSDTIWFKAYVTSGIHSPSTLSKIVYVELRGNQDSLIQSLKLQVTNGTASGNFILDPKYCRQGNYHISAYTRWMMNFESDYFFSKTLPVGSSASTAVTHIQFADAGTGTHAKIEYKDNNGAVYADKKVTWEMVGNAKKPVKGSGVTDAKGLLDISIPDSQLPDLSTGSLTTLIDPGNNAVIKNTFSLKAAAKTIDLQFFPEGGDLVNGLESRVAFKALKAGGLGVTVKGIVTDNDGKQVAAFTAQHLGMGSFTFTPAAGKTYTATLTGIGTTEKYALPLAKTTGVVMLLSNVLPDKISFRFSFSDDFFAANTGKTLAIMARTGQTICYAANLLLMKNVYTVTVPKEKFPTGIIEFTLFADNGKPLAQRLAFVQRPDNLNLTVKTDKPVSARKQAVRMIVNAKNGLAPAIANLSVSVIDETKVPVDENAETTILTSLLLTSDLKGFVEKPNYYFRAVTDQTAADLDVLMLTQGYRRFTYADILSNKHADIYFLPEQGIEVTGILRTSMGIPVNKGNVKISIPEKGYTAYAVTNGSGVFKFPNINLSDSATAIITSVDYSNKNPMMSVDQSLYKPAEIHFNRQDELLNIDSTMNLYLQNTKQLLKSSTVLKEIVLTTKAPAAKIASHLDYPTLAGLPAIADHVLTRDRLENCPDLLECIKNILPGVTYDNGYFYVTRDFNSGNKTPMQVFYNGSPVDAGNLTSMSGTDIESIEVFLKDVLGTVTQMYHANGVISVNVKKVEKGKKMTIAEIQALLPKPGEMKFIPGGYSHTREFYSPKYDTPERLAHGSDLRTTLYWNPKVITDAATGTATLDFYNADSRGTFKVTVEGIDADGHIGRAVYRYKIE